MRTSLEHIERINSYLAGGMTPEQHAQFEAEVAGDPVLQDQLSFQQDMAKVIQRRALRSEIQSVARQYGGGHSGFSWMVVVISGIVAVAGVVGYFLVNHDPVPAAPKTSLQQTQPASVETTVSPVIEPDSAGLAKASFDAETVQGLIDAFMRQGTFDRPEFLGVPYDRFSLPLTETAAVPAEQSMALTDFSNLNFVPKNFASGMTSGWTQKQLDSMYFASGADDPESGLAQQEYITVNCWNTLPGVGAFTESRLHLKGSKPKKNTAFGYVFNKAGDKLKDVTIAYSYYGDMKTITTDKSGYFIFKMYGKITTDVTLTIPGYGTATLPAVVFQSKKGTYFQVDLPEYQPVISGKHASGQKQTTIAPLAVKTIRMEPFQQTFLATHAFEARLQQLYLLPNGQELLDLYVNNLNKNLSEVDAMVAKRLNGDQQAIFERFSAAGLTRVATNPEVDQKALTDYYNRHRGI